MVLMKVLTIMALMVLSLPPNSYAEQLKSKRLILFQEKVLLYPQSPTLAMEVRRVSGQRVLASVFSIPTGTSIGRARIFSMTHKDEVSFFFGENDSNGSIKFKDDYRNVILLNPQGGYRETVMYHPTGDIEFLVAMVGHKSSFTIFNRERIYGEGW
jgi:hypothetical protein